ncbi:MAG: SDR family oxidoreductase [Ardenticatenia bacterium]|nr:MAG: SDR family oxidoreductase [Ardenticatenia bacterium]
MRLQGAVVVITGSTRGFGNTLARMLLEKGARVVISGRSQERVDTVVATLAQHGDVSGLACDVRHAEQVYALARHARTHFGRIDVWVNNAGIATPAAGGILDFPPDVAETIFQVNCLGTLHGTQAAVAVMKRQGGGTIVNLYGRGSDLRPATPSGLYGASKAWITSFTRTAAAEYKHVPIQFIGFSPGMMLTDMLDVHEIVGDTVAAQMRNYPLVLQALAHPPERPAAELVRLLETNTKRFVEYRYMSGLRLARMLAHLAWLRLTKGKQIDQPTWRQQPAFDPWPYIAEEESA